MDLVRPQGKQIQAIGKEFGDRDEEKEGNTYGAGEF